jgi:hypothetical protein
LTLADINGDSRIQIKELFEFLVEIDGGQTSADAVIDKVASIAFATGEPLDKFISLHEVKFEKELGLVDLYTFLHVVFRVCKFEAYLVF